MKWSFSALGVGLILVAAAFVGGEMTAGVRASHTSAAYRDSLHRADSVVQMRDHALGDAKARTDSASRSVARLLAAQKVDTMWRHDIVYVAGDTTPRYAVPIPTVMRQDSTNAACELLAVTCKAERVAAENRADAAEHKLALVQAKPERSCVHAFWWGAAAGAAGDELAHGRIQIPLLSIHR